MTDSDYFITPCPFSTHYRIPIDQAWRLLQIFWIARLILTGLLVILFFTGWGPTLLGSSNAWLYTISSSLYLGGMLLAAVPLFCRRPGYTFQAQIHLFIDIIAITMLMHASGGVASGMGMLLAVTVAAGGLLIGGRCALLFAALASLAILTEQIHADITHAFTTTAYTYTGILGASFFATALLAMLLAQRAEQSEARAVLHRADLKRLQQLNQYVIQHLQSGIIILDTDQRIRSMNDAALQLFKFTQSPAELTKLSSSLSRHYQHWLQHSDTPETVLERPGSISIHIRFTRLDAYTHMIFLQDNRLHNQRVQQSKLASLGHLSASIAHEIRNPLSAIKHAGQLLAESPHLDAQDLRLTHIINDHSVRMNNTIENVLQLSRRTPPRQQTLSLNTWLQDYVRDFRWQAPQQNRHLVVQHATRSVRICIDPGHLRQILDKLCDNALKYGHTQQHPVQLRITRDTESQAPCLEISDHGPGIQGTLKEQIFEPFFTTSTSGTGLGLYIARELAEMNQSSLSCTTATSGGCCFRLILVDAEQEAIAL